MKPRDVQLAKLTEIQENAGQLLSQLQASESNDNVSRLICAGRAGNTGQLCQRSAGKSGKGRSTTLRHLDVSARRRIGFKGVSPMEDLLRIGIGAHLSPLGLHRISSIPVRGLKVSALGSCPSTPD